MFKSDAAPLAYSYVRMSTDIQLRGDSLRRQQESSRRYALEHGLSLVEDFKLEDIGVSAFKGANVSSGSLGRFLELVKSGTIAKGSYLLVESLDRISRQEIMESMTLFLDVIRSGINIVTLVDNRLYPAGKADFTDLIYSVIVLSRAFEESMTKSVRVAAAWSNKRNNLDTKKLTKVCPGWLSLSEDRKVFAVIPSRGEIVTRIFNEAEKGFGSHSIAKRLNLDQIPTFGKAAGWHESYVSKILVNRAAIGEFQLHRYEEGKRVPTGDPVANYFPALVSEDQFLRVQAGRRKRLFEGAGRKGPEYRNLFSHIAKCEYCGASMRFVKGTGPKGGTYLKCSNAVQRANCETSGWKYPDFEASFLFFVKEVDLSATLAAAGTKSARTAIEENISAADEKLRELNGKRERVFELLALSTATTEFVTGKLEECQSEIELQQGLIFDLHTELAKISASPEITTSALIEQIDALQKASGTSAFEMRSSVAQRLRSIVTSLTVAVEGVRPKLKRAGQILRSSTLPAEDTQKIIDRIHESNVDHGRYNRTFSVTLADGISRRVIVDRENPKRFVVQAEINGEQKLVIHGAEAISRHVTIS